MSFPINKYLGADLAYIIDGAVSMLKGASRWSADLNEIKFDGISKVIKAAVADFEAATWWLGLPEAKFKFATRNLREVKDFFYALKIVDTVNLLFSGKIIPNKKDKDGNDVMTAIAEKDGNVFVPATINENGDLVIEPKKTVAGKIIRDADGKIVVDVKKEPVKDYWQGASNILLGIANCFDTAKYLQKNNVFDFTYFSKLGQKYGNARLVFYAKPENAHLDYSFSELIKNIPLWGNIVSKPKEIFVFFASACDLKVLYNKWEGLLEDYLKLIATVGKMTILAVSNTSIGRAHAGYAKAFMVALDVATQNSGMINHLIVCKKNRDKHADGLLKA